MSLGRAIVYFISSLFMFLAGNMQNWLIPWLVDNGFPTWVTGSFVFLGIIFVFATLLNMWFVGKLAPKEPNELKEIEKKKIIKKEAVKHGKHIKVLIGDHKRELRETVKKECDSVKANLEPKITSLEDECGRKQITIDVLSTELAKTRQEQGQPNQTNVKRHPEYVTRIDSKDAVQLNGILSSLKDSK